ncbi:MAG: hypothetical protein AMXMBFR84_18770 [Candidatus Hydrogenedentota bacterium]
MLYPAEWTPAFSTPSGQFLHDFSYSGYRLGDDPLPVDLGRPVFEAVQTFGADPTGATDSTAAIQAAIDAAGSSGGGIVHLAKGLYRCDGLLTVSAPFVTIRGAGPADTRVFFTRTYDMSYKSHLTFRGAVQRGPDIPLVVDGLNRSMRVELTDASSLRPGDEIAVGWVITDPFVKEHGMTGTWQAFNGQWRPFFRRTITAIDGNQVAIDVPLRYDAKIRDAASVRVETGYVRECSLEDLGIANAVDYATAWNLNQVCAVSFDGVADSWARNVHSVASPHPDGSGFHLQSVGIRVSGSKRVTIAGCSMDRPQNRGGGGNGYLFELGTSNEVLIRDCVATNGRHNFIQNWDFGASGLVFLRCHSAGGRNLNGVWDPIGFPAYSEYHHSLAMANLVDSCTLDDGWYGGNRQDWSSGAGHSVTQSVFWNTEGAGRIRSFQYGMGYVIGTQGVSVDTLLFGQSAEGTAPADFVEGLGRGADLEPQSLYEDQRIKRLGAK